jgi:PTH1 family peptidyl-tRNA hydrolase
VSALKCIVGLGNPGARYAGSRHNIGFDVVERFARREGFEGERRKFQALYREKVLPLPGGAEKVYLVRPQTYMNESGHAVRDFLGFFGADTTNDLTGTLLVVVDDIDLPSGKLRYRARGSAGGHRGFSRLRVGVGRRPGADAADYVLEKVDAEERQRLDRAVEAAAASLSVWLAEGIDSAMNRFNHDPDSAPARPDPL